MSQLFGPAEARQFPERPRCVNSGDHDPQDSETGGRAAGFDREPSFRHPPLRIAPGVPLTPHYAGNHAGYMDRAAENSLGNQQRLLKARRLAYIVDQVESC